MLDGFLAGLISSNTLGSWQDIFLGSTLLVSWIALALVLRMLWVTKVKVAGIDHRCRELSHDLQIAGNAAIGMGQRIIHLEKRLQQSVSVSAKVTQPVVNQSTVNQPASKLSTTSNNAVDRVVPIQAEPERRLQAQAPQQQATQTSDTQLTAGEDGQQESLKQRIEAAAQLKAVQDGLAKSTDAFYQTATQQKVKPQINQNTRPGSSETSHSIQKHQTRKPQPASDSNPSSSVSAKDSVVSPFDQAKRLLSKGMSEVDVAKRCGLSKAEAALLAMVQRQSHSSSNAAVS